MLSYSPSMRLTCEVREVKVTKAAGSVASGLRSRCSLPFLMALAKAWMRSWQNSSSSTCNAACSQP